MQNSQSVGQQNTLDESAARLIGLDPQLNAMAQQCTYRPAHDCRETVLPR
ncbi:hypothetical protein I5P86_07910 [Pseudomonas glycinae]|nr:MULTISPECIES: hypothetical protein [Pseudomonas]MBH3404973.1 hypothetical protein [Pseudomonas glycinae]MDI3397213.1 hypothetical protein [Pseudomonas sp. V88_4]